MPDDTLPAGQGAPAAPPAQNPPAAAPPAQPADTMTLTTAQLNERLERAKSTVLKDLGVSDLDKAKAAIAAAAKAEEDAKSAAQKLGETAATVKSLNDELERHKAVTRDHASRQLAVLTMEQQAAVKALAGEDPAMQLRAIDTLRPTWSVAPVVAQPQPAAPPSAAPAPAPPATTAPPAAAAPPAAGPSSPPDHKSEYKALQKTNPVAAAHYLQAHAKQIYPEQ